jgi:hypothetical protein
MLHDRSYIGEVPFHGEWYPGKHEPLIDRSTWNRVQEILGGHFYRSHELTFGGELIRCGFCSYPITGERKFKQSSTGERAYTYYRCAKYTTGQGIRERECGKKNSMSRFSLCLTASAFRTLRFANGSGQCWRLRLATSSTKPDHKGTSFNAS